MTAPDPGGAPATAPDDPYALPGMDKALPCIHCGLCLEHCPTYRVLCKETDSPRGRVYLMRAQAEGRIGFTDNFITHISLCLNCRACETACPSNVEFGPLMEATRGRLYAAEPKRYRQGLTGELLLKFLIPQPALLRVAFALLRIFSPVLTGPLRFLLSPEQRNFIAMLPSEASGSFNRQSRPQYRAYDARVASVALLTGCAMDVLFDNVHADTVKVLQVNGCDVSVPREQPCCGALHAHAGRAEEARDMARRLIDRIDAQSYDAIITNAAGCGAHLKTYGHLLEDDPDYAERARAFAAKVRDITEYLAGLSLTPPSRTITARVAYDDPCHLLHGQKISRQPRDLLKMIPGVELVDFAEADSCCGSAGIYNVTHAAMSLQILDRKMQHLAAAQPDVIATANPGCMLQLRLGAQRAGLDCAVVHPVSLLAQAYR